MEKFDPKLEINRSEGVTPAERYLQRLCDRSFLSLWSYPNVFRDQKTGGKGDGKELCDLLVVFGDDILIFSDKSCAFPHTGRVQVAWCRWFKKAVMESAKQAWGAERWLREFPSRVFLDKLCTHPFPLQLPPSDRMRVHHIVVAHNVSRRTTKFFRGGNGTLVFNSDIRGADHYRDPDKCRPFEVGWLDATRQFVHVLDDSSLEIVLSTLDTITDFVDYLCEKESLFTDYRDRGARFTHAGEENLLANYLMTLKSQRHTFDFPETDALMLDDGDWLKYKSGPHCLAKTEADEVSYNWDRIIERFTTYISYNNTSSLTLIEREKGLRFLARENRVRRRMLAQEILGMLETTKHGYGRRRVVIPPKPGDPYYVFLLCGRRPNLTDKEYREYRELSLRTLCCITKVEYPEAQDIVGFATETGLNTWNRSEDLIWMDVRQWSDEEQVHWKSVQKKTGFLTNSRMMESWVSEFPVPQARHVPAPKGRERNDPCPCGSGRKYKKCHGR